MLAEGQCIYSGSIPGLVPYMAAQGMTCPPYHNPADYGTYACTKTCHLTIKLQPTIFPLSQHVIRFHELPADTTQRFLQ